MDKELDAQERKEIELTSPRTKGFFAEAKGLHALWLATPDRLVRVSYNLVRLLEYN
jgi:hypothetical protein